MPDPISDSNNSRPVERHPDPPPPPPDPPPPPREDKVEISDEARQRQQSS